jgi:hypothetical protein
VQILVAREGWSSGRAVEEARTEWVSITDIQLQRQQ